MLIITLIKRIKPMINIKYKAPFFILLVASITLGISTYSSYQDRVLIIKNAQKNELRSVATFIQNDLIDQSNNAASKVAMLIERPDVKKAFREQNRAALTNLILPTFKVLKERFDLREMQFNLPLATVFLRLHNLPLFGDDDSSFREMLLMSINNKKGYQGIEIGRSGISMRAVDIIEDTQGVIGTVEVGLSFATILNDIKKNTAFNAAIFVDDELISRIAQSRPRASQERIFGELQGIGATDWNKILPFMSTSLLSKVNDVSLFTKKFNGVDYGIALIPLLDFKNKEIGVIVAVCNYAHYQSLLTAALISSLSLALLQLIVLVGVVLITFNTLCLRPIEHMNALLASKTPTKDDEQLRYLASRGDEIGQLASHIIRLDNGVENGSDQPSPTKPSSTNHPEE